jgi:pilus assembly protein CpaF
MIYGEVRDKAAYDMLNGANTGHKVLSTLHSRTAPKAVQRLINMVLEHGSKMSTEAIGQWISESIDIIIFQKLYADKKRRIKEIIELKGYKEGQPLFEYLFRFVVQGRNEDGTFNGRHYRTGRISKDIAELMIDEGANMEEVKQFLRKPETPPEWAIDLDEEDEEKAEEREAKAC